MVLLSATAVSRAVQRLCRRAWLLARTGAKVAPWRWLAWIALWLGALVVQGLLHNGFGQGVGLGAPVILVMQAAMWWWTQHLLLAGVVRWAPLLPGAVITAIAVSGMSVTAHFYMPRALNRALADYSSAGSVLILLSWLIIVCVAVAIGLSAGAVLSQEPFLKRRLGTPPSPPGETEHACPPRRATGVGLPSKPAVSVPRRPVGVGPRSTTLATASGAAVAEARGWAATPPHGRPAGRPRTYGPCGARLVLLLTEEQSRPRKFAVRHGQPAVETGAGAEHRHVLAVPAPPRQPSVAAGAATPRSADGDLCRSGAWGPVVMPPGRGWGALPSASGTNSVRTPVRRARAQNRPISIRFRETARAGRRTKLPGGWQTTSPERRRRAAPETGVLAESRR